VRGDLRESGLAALMRRLYSERKSGVLHVSASGQTRRLYFRKGAVIFADAGDGAEKPTRERSETLLRSIFSWTRGQFSFEERDPEIDETLAFQKPPAELILEGSRSILDPRVLETLVPTRSSVFARSQTTELSLFTVKLSPVESAILKLARERERFAAADLSQISSEASVSSALNVLVSLGLLDIVPKVEAPPPVPEPVKEPVPVAASPSPSPSPSPSTPALPREDVEVLEKSAKSAASDDPKTKAAPPPRPVMASPKIMATPRMAPRPKRAPPAPTDSAGRRAEAASTAAPVSPRAPAGRVRLGKWLWIAAASVSIAGAAFLLALWLLWGNPEMPELPAVVSAASEPSSPELPEIPKPPPDIEAQEPTAAELLSRAKIALEGGDLEAAKSELEALRKLQPEHIEAQELLARVDRDLAPAAPSPPADPKPRRSRTSAGKAGEPAAAEPIAHLEPVNADPARMLDEARNAFAQGDLDAASARLDEILALDADFPGAWRLREDVADKRWERTLPHKYGARHAHRLGGCVGVVILTASGITYASNEHQWTWSFPELRKAVRKDERHLGLETRDGKSYNFELGEPLSALEWTRFLELAR
jgi:hypothetical protein